MSAATPTKRRALGSLDINVTRSPSSSSASAANLLGKSGASPLKRTVAISRHATTPSPARKDTPKKRSLVADAEIASPAFKKLCSATATAPNKETSPAKDANVVAKPKAFVVEDVDEDSPPASQPSARRSISPDASSLFDNSAINTSQLTTITEPDAPVPITTTTTNNAAVLPPAAAAPVFMTVSAALGLPPPRPRRVPTREDFRQKAEILKLRLSLANYKVKTNQTNVPLDKLQIRPVPGMTRRRTPLPSMSAHTVQRATPAQYWYRSLPSSQTPVLDKDSTNTDDDIEEEEEEAGEREGDGDENGNENGDGVLPKLGMVSTPRRQRSGGEEEARLTSSALRGGAAKGLLSLSQASRDA